MASAPPYIANFDSTSAMVRALGRFLKGKDFPATGVAFNALLPLAAGINRLPRAVREQIYIWSGWNEAIQPRKLHTVSAERVARWMVSEYPRRRYPAVAIGSASGAMTHLWAALGIPWLPQTFLIPVRRHMHPDEPKQDMEWGMEPGGRLLEANPELQLHHMNDANQDRLMIRRMTYFRVKRLRLGDTYEKFLEEVLPPGGTIFISECDLKWPTVKVGERHYFQHGALGGATPEEFHEGSPRVEEYLERYGSHRRRWDSPGGDDDRPEAEWGFEPALRQDIERIAKHRGYKVRRVRFDEPADPSPLVAELYRDWYRRRRIIANRLVVSSFMIMEPYWTVRTGSAPFWMTFNKEPSAEALENYIEHAGPFDEIYMMLFSHGVDSVGLVPIERWKRILSRARRRGEFIGVDPERYPRDFAAFIRYNVQIKRKIASRYPMPGPMSIDKLDEFLRDQAHKFAVRWIESDREVYGPQEREPVMPGSTGLE